MSTTNNLTQIKAIPYTTTSGSGNPQLSAIKQLNNSNENHTNLIKQLAGKRFKKNKLFGGTSQIIAPTINVAYKQTLPSDNPQSVQGISNSINALKVNNDTNSIYDKNAYKGGFHRKGYTTMTNWGCFSGGKKRKTTCKKRKVKRNKKSYNKKSLRIKTYRNKSKKRN